jgi:NADP-dependent 3-hydroxy acid dehydrogenase YdfG
MQEILITGAGSGLGEGSAIGLAQKGYSVIAAVQTWPQVSALRERARLLGLKTLKVEKLDLLDTYDVAHALKWKQEILVNNAGIARVGLFLRFLSSLCDEISKRPCSRLWILHNA